MILVKKFRRRRDIITMRRKDYYNGHSEREESYCEMGGPAPAPSLAPNSLVFLFLLT